MTNEHVLKIVRLTHAEHKQALMIECAEMFGHRLAGAESHGIPRAQAMTFIREHFLLLSEALKEFSEMAPEMMVGSKHLREVKR